MNRYLIPLLLFASQLAFAQTIPVNETVGNVSEKEMNLRTYEPDPFASAVILWENCEESVELDVLRAFVACRTTVTQRLKILKTSGCRYANLSMVLSEDQTLKDVSITTWNIDKYGNRTATPITKNDCVRKNISEREQEVTYYAQKVKPGSVVEISYTLISPLGQGRHDFYFQRSIPVNLATYSMKKANLIQARKLMKNCTNVKETTPDNYRATDIPAFKDEPMVYYPDQYIPCVSYDFKVFETYADTWADVARMYKESAVLRQLNNRTPIRKEVREIAATDDEDKDKLTKILAQIFSKVIWNREIGVMPYPFEYIGTVSFGNSADINSFAGAAFTEAGYTVTPVFIRLRSNGAVDSEFPSPDVFDTYILHVSRPETGFDAVLDASNTNLYINVLPDEFLVEDAFEVHKDGTFTWVDLTNLCPNTSIWRTFADVNPEGHLESTLTANYYNASSFRFKDTYTHSTDSVIVREMSKLIDADTLKTISLGGFGEFGQDSRLRIDYSKECKVDADGSITVKPFVLNFFSESEFRPEQRTMPLEFSYTENVNYSFMLQIPEGYEVAELPESTRFSADAVPPMVISIGATDQAISADGQSVLVNLKFTNMALSVSPEQYPAVREMWLKAARLLADSKIVFKKK